MPSWMKSSSRLSISSFSVIYAPYIQNRLIVTEIQEKSHIVYKLNLNAVFVNGHIKDLFILE